MSKSTTTSRNACHRRHIYEQDTDMIVKLRECEDRRSHLQMPWKLLAATKRDVAFLEKANQILMPLIFSWSCEFSRFRGDICASIPFDSILGLRRQGFAPAARNIVHLTIGRRQRVYEEYYEMIMKGKTRILPMYRDLTTCRRETASHGSSST